MRFSLPLIFVLQTALLIGAMVGIITSFVLVTNDSIATAVENSIENNLNTFAESVNTIVQETEPVAKQAMTLAHVAWNESGRRKGEPSYPGIAAYNHTLSYFTSEMVRNAKFVYVYESFEIAGSGGRWGELSCGVFEGIYSCTSTNRSNYDEYIEGPEGAPLPLDYTIADEYDYDPTEEAYIQYCRNMTAAAGHDVSGFWHPPSAWFDTINNASRPLMTYSFPAAFDPEDGHTISGYNVDVDVAIMSEQLSALARQNNLLYLVDVPTLAMIVSSKPTSEVPVIDYSNSEDGEWFIVPHTSTAEINAGMRTILDYAGGGVGLGAQAAGFHVLSMDDTVVSYRHIRRGTLHWIAVDHTPRDFYFGEARRVSTILIVVAVLVLFICLAVCVVVYLAVVTPINNLAVSMDRISKLEPTSEESLEPPALSELQPMHTAFIKLDVALKSFTRYVPRGVVKELIDSNQLCKLAMMPRQCSILFSDIAGFTSISERVPAAQLSRLIHTYFNRMSRIVMEHNGMIDKFIGDCIMAVWGAPVPQEHHELRATLAGMLLELEARSDPLATDFDEVGELLSIRVGVNSGDVLAGNMGSDERMNYTVIGDNVNLSSRLEAFNKSMGTHVMVSAGTVAGLQDKVVLRLLCRVAVVGKEEPVEVYEACGLDGSQSTKLAPPAVDRFAGMNHDMGASLKQLRSGDQTASAVFVMENGSGSFAGSDSEMSIRSGEIDVFREHRVTSLLKAGRKRLICEAKEVDFAREYTEAARLFMRNECGEAMQRVAKLKTEYPTMMEDHAAVYLEKAASQQLSNPDPQFDAVFRATEK